MIGRRAIGNPWCFKDFEKFPKPSMGEKIDKALEHYNLLCELKSDKVAVFEFRKYLTHYLQGFNKAKEWRQKLIKCQTSIEFFKLINNLREIIN